jgi:hypothetical protein
MIKKIAGTIFILIVSAAISLFYYFIPLVLLPLLLYLLWRLWAEGKIEIEEIQNLKYSPFDDRRSDRVRLDGNWDVRCRGIAWQNIKLPSDMATVNGLNAKRKRLQFKRRVDLPQSNNSKKAFLCGSGFGGIGKVLINGSIIENSVFGYLPFEIELPESINGESSFELMIEINGNKSCLAPGCELGLAPSFGAGLFRELYLEFRESIWFSNARFIPVVNTGEKVLMLEIKGQGIEYPVAVSVQIESVKDKKLIFDDTQIVPGFSRGIVVCFHIKTNILKSWSPENTELYRISTQAVCGEIRISGEFTSGYSHIELKDEKIFTDDGMTSLRGVKRSEHFPPYGAAVPKWAAKKDIQVIKETGLNVVYCTDYPPHPDFMEECDRSGLYFIAEFPFEHACRTIGHEGACKLLKETTINILSHPSFVFWTLPKMKNDKLEKEIKIVMEEAGAEGRAVFAYEAIYVSGKNRETSYSAKNIDVNLYRIDLLNDEIKESKKSGAGLLTLEYIDTAGGSEDRRTREMRKAAADLIVLKAADSMHVGALIIGRLFTWGIRQGILSINRSKKASSDNIREYLRTREVSEPDFSEFPIRLPLRLVPLIALFFVFSWIAVPMARAFFIAAPPVYLCFHNPMHFIIIGAGMFAVSVFSISLLFEWRRGWLPGIAPLLGYPLMFNLYNRHWVRLLITSFTCSYLFFIGAIIVSAMSGQTLATVIVPLLSASAFDAFFIVFLFAPIEPMIVFLASGLLGGLYLCWFLNPAEAFAFEAICRFPWMLCLLFLKRKDVFRRRLSA